MTWRRSSACKADSPMCVEAAVAPDGWVKLRDSKDPSVVLTLDPGDWDAFVAGIVRGDFSDLPVDD